MFILFNALQTVSAVFQYCEKNPLFFEKQIESTFSQRVYKIHNFLLFALIYLAELTAKFQEHANKQKIDFFNIRLFFKSV